MPAASIAPRSISLCQFGPNQEIGLAGLVGGLGCGGTGRATGVAVQPVPLGAGAKVAICGEALAGANTTGVLLDNVLISEMANNQ